MSTLVYRDLFGGWRWEYRDAEGHYRDSQQSYDTREDCVRAAQQAGVGRDALSISSADGEERSVLCAQASGLLDDLLQEALAGYRVMRARNSLDAIRCLTSSIFDAYVIDCDLPESSGIHLCRHIRRKDPHTPICFYGASASERQRKQAFDAGADGFVCSTAGSQALADEIDALIRASEAKSLRARLDEERAVRDELQARTAAAIARAADAQVLAASAVESAAKAKARAVFFASGGTPANFDRWWPQLFSRAVEPHI